MRSSRSFQQRILGLIDIGTSKVACLIVAVEPRGPSILPGMDMPFRVLGAGHQRARGIKAGVITDLDEAEVSVRAAVDQAERMAGVTLDEVYVAVACGRLRSENFASTGAIDSGVVSDEDIARVLDGGRSYAEREGRMLVHMNRIGVRLDGAPGGNDPRGMAAAELSIDLHAVTADDAPVRNLLLLVERCYLGVAGLVVSPFASALAATTAEERRLGVTVIDIGAGVTTIAQFSDGHLIHADTVPVGGNLMTFDVARALQTPLVEAERIKALYGTVVRAPSDEHEAFGYPLAGEGEGEMHQTTKAILAEILRPRAHGLISLAMERIEHSGVSQWSGDRVVLTGGGSQLVGLAEFTANMIGRPVRASGPDQAAGLPTGLAMPTFSTVVGLVSAAAAGHGLVTAHGEKSLLTQGYLVRVGQWLKRGF
ncbi:MAG: cell division protein FtsA [Hyphomicrobiaceae bacterium]|nr:cell division protein FtsA [Hyphomicrobiaceae bacterium]